MPVSGAMLSLLKVRLGTSVACSTIGTNVGHIVVNFRENPGFLDIVAFRDLELIFVDCDSR